MRSPACRRGSWRGRCGRSAQAFCLSLLALALASHGCGARRLGLVGDPHSAAWASEAFARLERTLRPLRPAEASHGQPWGGVSAAWRRRERDIADALSAAESAIAMCGGDVADCREGLRVVIEACDAIVGGGYSQDLQRSALAILSQAADAGSLDDAGRRRVVEVCERAAELRSVALTDVLQTLDAVAEHEGSSMATLQAVAIADLRLMQGSDLPEVGPAKPRFFLEVMSSLSRFAHRIADHAPACMSLVRAACFVINATNGSGNFASVRLLVMYMLEEILPLVQSEDVLVEVLGVVDMCAESVFDPDVIRNFAAVMLETVARRLSEAHLERVLGASTKVAIAGRPDAMKAATTVATRALADDFDSGIELKVHLIAESFAALERMGAVVPCNRGLRLLGRLQPLEPRFVSLARRLHGSKLVLPEELLVLVDAFMQPLSEESTRSRIVQICARAARRKPTLAKDVLSAACLLPRRVGSDAAVAFSGLAVGADSVWLREGIAPVDFATVGDCLAGSLRLWRGRGAHADDGGGDAGDPYGGLDASAVERIASSLLRTVASIFDLWCEEQWADALGSLCALAGGPHKVCER
eukprot:CAMPEP_0176046746 /NCGR_PEP_ID=MMETSP0120_2-20121206/23213_1 /TAXON_ID=160619 /ORGANISM="Kryptoperidinium foliaceum, Strain CCMP 1326" /LENGTH=586 /DNA_ID=CAMNT_0017380159 /DNA_START=1 /DNA_END=1757 /DNA_ORIENTATION=-